MSPLEAQPFDVVENVLHILGIFLARIGIVESQVADTVIALSHTKVHANGLGMANMQVAVGLRWETGLDAAVVLAGRKIFFNQLLYKT